MPSDPFTLMNTPPLDFNRTADVQRSTTPIPARPVGASVSTSHVERIVLSRELANHVLLRVRCHII